MTSAQIAAVAIAAGWVVAVAFVALIVALVVLRLRETRATEQATTTWQPQPIAAIAGECGL